MNASRAYAANGLNQYTAVGGATPSYDANGNLTGDGTYTYNYDAENRLTGSSRNGATLTYDPLGRLWQISSSATGTTQFAHDGAEVAAEYDGATGAMRRRFVWGPGADEPILQDEGGALDCTGTRFLHTDELGSVIAQADCQGHRTAVNSYDEYGVPAATNTGRYQYTGQAWSPELGLYYYKARMYAPSLGRFIQTDPIGYGDGLNWYGYVGGDPVNLSDPSGTTCKDGTADDGTGCVGHGGPGTVVTVNGNPCTFDNGCRVVSVGDLQRTVVIYTPNAGYFNATEGDIIVVGKRPQSDYCSGPRLTLGGGVSGTVFAAIFGASAGLGGSVSVPYSSLSHFSLRGINFTGSLSLTPLVGFGAFLGAGKSFSGGVSTTDNLTIGGRNANLTITPVIQAGAGDEAGIEIQNSFTNPLSLSGAAGRIAVGAYAAVGLQFSGNLSTGNIGCGG